MRSFGVILVGGLAAWLALPALAARPFATEDAAVLEPRACELESFVSHETARGAANVSGGWVQSGCGVGSNTQLALGLGLERTGEERSTAAQLVGKTFMQAQQDDRPGFTVAYRFAGSTASGCSFMHESSDIGVVASIPWRGSLVHANLGWSRSHSSRQSSTTWAIAFERPAAGRVDVGVEVFGNDRSVPWLGLGLRWTLTEHISVDASFAGKGGSTRTTATTLGMKFAY